MLKNDNRNEAPNIGTHTGTGGGRSRNTGTHDTGHADAAGNDGSRDAPAVGSNGSCYGAADCGGTGSGQKLQLPR